MKNIIKSLKTLKYINNMDNLLTRKFNAIVYIITKEDIGCVEINGVYYYKHLDRETISTVNFFIDKFPDGSFGGDNIEFMTENDQYFNEKLSQILDCVTSNDKNWDDDYMSDLDWLAKFINDNPEEHIDLPSCTSAMRYSN